MLIIKKIFLKKNLFLIAEKNSNNNNHENNNNNENNINDSKIEKTPIQIETEIIEMNLKKTEQQIFLEILSTIPINISFLGFLFSGKKHFLKN